MYCQYVINHSNVGAQLPCSSEGRDKRRCRLLMLGENLLAGF